MVSPPEFHRIDLALVIIPPAEEHIDDNRIRVAPLYDDIASRIDVHFQFLAGSRFEFLVDIVCESDKRACQ
jgi:hypothetical protein